MLRAPIALSLLAAAAAAPAQTVHIVQGDRLAFERTVQSAVAGDVLLVRAGRYQGTLIDKGLTIRCDPGVFLVDYGIQVVNIPVGQEFSMSGGRIEAVDPFSGLIAQVRDCRGPILFDDIELATSPVEILRSEAVHLSGCRFQPGGLRLRFSNASLSGCRTDASLGSGTERGSLQIAASHVSLHDSTIDGVVSGSVPALGRPAVYLHSGSLDIAGDGSTAVRAGAGSNVVAAIATVSGALRIDPAVTLQGANGPAISGPVTPQWAPLPSTTIDHAVAGQLLTATLRAEPGSTSVALLSAPIAPVEVPGVGLVWSAPGSAALVGGVVPTTGTLVASLQVPVSVQRAALVVQPASLSTTGVLVGPPTAFLVR